MCERNQRSPIVEHGVPAFLSDLVDDPRLGLFPEGQGLRQCVLTPPGEAHHARAPIFSDGNVHQSVSFERFEVARKRRWVEGELFSQRRERDGAMRGESAKQLELRYQQPRRLQKFVVELRDDARSRA